MIKILSYLLHADHTGTLGYLCEMADGSHWFCDMKMKNWRKTTPTLTELERAFANGFDEAVDSGRADI